MILSRTTSSLCTTCYKEIPAVITVSADGVWMTKTCSDHGLMKAMVERDPIFYSFIQSLKSQSIYNGYFLDVTRVCNLRCKFCYYDLEKADPAGEYTVENLVSECRVNIHRSPFIITGGEPTTRPDIVELVSKISDVGPAEMITNGTKLCDQRMFDAIVPLLTRNGATMIHLSIHEQETDKWREVIARGRASSVKLGSILIVINNRDEFLKAVEMAVEFRDVALGVRIKSASQIWNEGKPGSSFSGDKIFVSDMLQWLEESGRGYQVVTQLHNKSVFFNVLIDGVYVMLVSWHDVGNVDLLDIDCPPYYRARNGEVANMVTAMLINEGMKKGFMKGIPIQA